MAGLWDKIRKDFPITQHATYFDHAAGGPMPRPVQEAVAQYYSEQAEEADFAWPKWIERREQARKVAAQLIESAVGAIEDVAAIERILFTTLLL